LVPLRKNILVICKSDDELNDKFTVTYNDSAAGPPVGMFPANTVVLLVDTHNVGMDFCLTFRVKNDAVQILNYT
jgi:hypothetical protein